MGQAQYGFFIKLGRLLLAATDVRANRRERRSLIGLSLSQVLRSLVGKRAADGQCGHRRTIMELPETELNATKRPVWNAGRPVGSKPTLNP